MYTYTYKSMDKAQKILWNKKVGNGFLWHVLKAVKQSYMLMYTYKYSKNYENIVDVLVMYPCVTNCPKA